MAVYNTKYAANGNGIILKGSIADDMLVGGTGDQALYGSSGNDYLIAGDGNQALYGGSGNDILEGAKGDQQLYGGSGSDTIIAGWGNQYLDGGSGIDVLDFSRLDAKIDFEQGARSAKVYDAAGNLLHTDTILSFDTIIGSNTGNTFHGQVSRATSFSGGDNADTFASKNGGDTLTGRGGSDTFVYEKKFVAFGKADTITDFEVGTDKLDLSDFLLNQGLLNPAYSQVARVVDAINADGSHSAMVQGQVYERWTDVVKIDHVDATAVTLNDLGLA